MDAKQDYICIDYFQKQSCLNRSCTAMRISFHHTQTVSSQTLRKGRPILWNIRLYLSPKAVVPSMKLGSCLRSLCENKLDQRTGQLQLEEVRQSGGKKPNPQRGFLLTVAPQIWHLRREFKLLPPGAAICTWRKIQTQLLASGSALRDPVHALWSPKLVPESSALLPSIPRSVRRTVCLVRVTPVLGTVACWGSVLGLWALGTTSQGWRTEDLP